MFTAGPHFYAVISTRLPAPGDPTTAGLAKYNLNPFVWFIHRRLGGEVFAYAFSVDDEYGNILLPNVTQLIVTVGGPNGLKNTDVFNPKDVNSPP